MVMFCMLLIPMITSIGSYIVLVDIKLQPPNSLTVLKSKVLSFFLKKVIANHNALINEK